MARAKSPVSSGQSSATIGFEAKLWLAAEIRRTLIEADLENSMVALPGRSSTACRFPTASGFSQNTMLLNLKTMPVCSVEKRS